MDGLSAGRVRIRYGNAGCVPPEALQPVISSGLFQKNMHHRITIVYQDPSPFSGPFDMVRLHLQFRQRLFDLLGDGLDLPGGGTAADDKVINEVGETGKIEYLQIPGLFFQACLYTMACKCPDVYVVNPVDFCTNCLKVYTIQQVPARDI